MGSGRCYVLRHTGRPRARSGTIVAEMKAICDEFEAYGYRRVDAELRHRGIVVNTKKIRRLMREHTLNPKQHRRFIATADSDHDYPISPRSREDLRHAPDGPELTLGGRHHLCRNHDWLCLFGCNPRLSVSRRVVGYAISRSD